MILEIFSNLTDSMTASKTKAAHLNHHSGDGLVVHVKDFTVRLLHFLAWRTYLYFINTLSFLRRHMKNVLVINHIAPSMTAVPILYAI